MQSTPTPLLIAPDFRDREYIRLTPDSAGWDHLSFAARRMKRGETWEFETHQNELALVLLGGTCQVTSNAGHWSEIGRRPNVFAGMPYTLYLPPGTQFTVEVTSEELDTQLVAQETTHFFADANSKTSKAPTTNIRR